MLSYSDQRWRSFLSLAIDAKMIRERASGTWESITNLCGSAAKTLIGQSIMAPFFTNGDDDFCNNTTATIKQEKTSVDRAEDIAVAVELKFLLPFRIEGGVDPEPSDPRPIQAIDARFKDDENACQEYAYWLVADTIKTAGSKATTIQAISTGGYAENNFWESHWIVKKANSAEPGPDEKRARSGGARYAWVPVEISSPKMAAGDPQTRRHIQRVLHALTARHRLAANYTCEVHVHLGRLDGRPFELPVLKRLASLLWSAEPTLRSIRDPNSPNYKNLYTWGSELRLFSRLAQSISNPLQNDGYHHQIEDRHVRDALRALPLEDNQSTDGAALRGIWQTSSRRELGLLLSGPIKQHRRLGFNFSAFGLEDERARRSPRTVEFRMMEGTVRTDLIINWVSICASIAEAAVAPDDNRFAAALRYVLQRGAAENKVICELDHESEPKGRRLGREFSGLMQELGIPRAVYAGFEEKVIREH